MSNEPNAPTLRDYLSAVRRFRLLIVVSTLAGTAVAFAGTRIYPRQFSATAAVGPVSSREPFPNDVMRWVFANEEIAAETVSSLKLDQPPNSLTPRAFIRDHMTAEPLSERGVWQIEVRLRDLETAIKAANTLAASVVRRLTESDRHTLAVELKSAEERVNKARIRQQELAAAALTFWSKVPGGRMRPPGQLSSERDIQGLIVDAELDAATKVYAEAFTAYEKMMLRRGTEPIGAYIDEPARPNPAASSPGPLVVMALGAALGAAVAVAVAVSLAFMRSQQIAAMPAHERTEIGQAR